MRIIMYSVLCFVFVSSIPIDVVINGKCVEVEPKTKSLVGKAVEKICENIKQKSAKAKEKRVLERLASK